MKNNQSKCEYKYYIRKILNKVTKCKNKKILLRKLNLSKKKPTYMGKTNEPQSNRGERYSFSIIKERRNTILMLLNILFYVNHLNLCY